MTAWLWRYVGITCPDGTILRGHFYKSYPMPFPPFVGMYVDTDRGLDPVEVQNVHVDSGGRVILGVENVVMKAEDFDDDDDMTADENARDHFRWSTTGSGWIDEKQFDEQPSQE